MILSSGSGSGRNRYGSKYGYTALFPIRDADCRVALRKSLLDMDAHKYGSPFSDVPRIHLARLIVWDGLPYQGLPSKADRLEAGYLIFMCDFDGETVRNLAGSLVVNAFDFVQDIWGKCSGFPVTGEGPFDTNAAAKQFADYLRRYQVETSLFFCDQPHATVEEILSGIKMQIAFAKFVEANQADDPVTLQQKFRQFWEDLKGSQDLLPGRLPDTEPRGTGLGEKAQP
ncbi:MAG: hypothetical protein AAF724_06435 [Pseudomonadota bacterium]